MEEKLNKILYINEDLIKKQSELRKKIYEKIICLKDYNIFDKEEHFLFQKAKQLYENKGEDEYQEFKKLVDIFTNLKILTQTINFYTKEIKKIS